MSLLSSKEKSNKHLPLCYNNLYKSGRWVLNNDNNNKKSFYCCDNIDYTNRSKEQICGTTNTDLNKAFYHSHELLKAPIDSSCLCDIQDNTREIKTKREKYVWKTDFCHLIHWYYYN